MVTIVGWDVVVVTFLRSQALRLSLLLGTARLVGRELLSDGSRVSEDSR